MTIHIVKQTERLLYYFFCRSGEPSRTTDEHVRLGSPYLLEFIQLCRISWSAVAKSLAQGLEARMNQEPDVGDA